MDSYHPLPPAFRGGSPRLTPASFTYTCAIRAQFPSRNFGKISSVRFGASGLTGRARRQRQALSNLHNQPLARSEDSFRRPGHSINAWAFCFPALRRVRSVGEGIQPGMTQEWV